MIESHLAFCCAEIAVWVRLSVLRTLADRDVRAPFCPRIITSGEAYIFR